MSKANVKRSGIARMTNIIVCTSISVIAVLIFLVVYSFNNILV